MKRLLVVGALVLLSGCATSTPPQPQPATPAPAVRRPGLPRIVYRVVLASPQGQGVIELRQELPPQAGDGPVYRAYGGILVTDDVAHWRFTYTKTSLEGPGPAGGEWIDGLHAMSVIMVNVTRGDLEVDWERSTFVDANGRAQRMIHRGIQLNQRTAQMLPSVVPVAGTLNEFVFPGDTITFSAPGRASVWNSPAIFERLAPGHEFSIVLQVKSGGAVTPRTFKFQVVPPPSVAPAPSAPR